jgi:hypothetical protein
MFSKSSISSSDFMSQYLGQPLFSDARTHDDPLSYAHSHNEPIRDELVDNQSLTSQRKQAMKMSVEDDILRVCLTPEDTATVTEALDLITVFLVSFI